jgi:Ca-activated chloride channel family protein
LFRPRAARYDRITDPEDRFLGFDRPLALLSLLLLPAIVAGYVLARRRRTRYAVRYTNLDVLGAVAPRLSSRREWATAALVVAVLGLLCVGVARPHVNRMAPIENATVVLVIDTSRSMLAEDVAPTRLGAAKRAAQAFLDSVPGKLRVGLVTFAGDVSVGASPTHDRERVRQSVGAITRWQAGGGTAIGDALARAVELAREAFAEPGRSVQSTGAIPGAEGAVTILFLSDGRQNRGLIPADQGAALAKGAGIPVFTVALGTDNAGPGGGQGGGFWGGFNRAPDRETLQAIARTTGGEYFAARSARALSSAYDDLGSRLGRAKRETEVTFLFVGVAALGLAAAAGLARVWEPGLP